MIRADVEGFHLYAAGLTEGRNEESGDKLSLEDELNGGLQLYMSAQRKIGKTSSGETFCVP